MSLNYTNINNLNHSIMTQNLSKSKEKNSDHLAMLGRKAKGQITPKVLNIITLYTQGKISQVETAENIIIKLTGAKTEKQQTTVFKQYDKLVAKHESKEPLNKRLAEKKEIKVVKTKAAKTITKAFKKHMEPKVSFNNLEKSTKSNRIQCGSY